LQFDTFDTRQTMSIMTLGLKKLYTKLQSKVYIKKRVYEKLS